MPPLTLSLPKRSCTRETTSVKTDTSGPVLALWNIRGSSSLTAYVLMTVTDKQGAPSETTPMVCFLQLLHLLCGSHSFHWSTRPRVTFSVTENSTALVFCRKQCPGLLRRIHRRVQLLATLQWKIALDGNSEVKSLIVDFLLCPEMNGSQGLP